MVGLVDRAWPIRDSRFRMVELLQARFGIELRLLDAAERTA